MPPDDQAGKDRPHQITAPRLSMAHTPPDFSKGIALEQLADGGMLAGKAGDDDVLLARRGTDYFAVAGKCPHYGASLAEGLFVDEQVRCPWHHACFNLRTGAVLRRPALDGLDRWRVELTGSRVFVREKLPSASPELPSMQGRQPPDSIVIVGGGAAALSAAATLRAEQYQGPVTVLSADATPPCDRPNLSKDYLSGDASDDWIPLRPNSWYQDQRIDLQLNARVTSIDTQQRQVQLADGRQLSFGGLLLATGADPIKLSIPGAETSRLHYLRTWHDSQALIAAAEHSHSVLVLGSSFIGLEVAASLRKRGLTVHVVSQEKQPLEHLFGQQVGAFMRQLHESKGVTMHLDDTLARLEGRTAVLKSGARVEADLIVAGVGVRPGTTLAEQAGLQVDNGVMVDEFLQTGVPGIFAAGDIARWPDARSGERIRVEHWVVAQRQGQTAARNLLGQRERFDAVPFFWTQQFGVTLDYVGHAQKWDRIEVDGELERQDCRLTYYRGDRIAAVLTVGRDLESLRCEVAMETS
jgi:NADPH-dependent 2,4-dienoyl-CoA reductase/sulfur reductase-like enzyme/nitrite reductase/ring-hydroxylating ferredoxin subunit